MLVFPYLPLNKQGFANFLPGTSSRRDSLDIGYRYFILALLFSKHAVADGPLWRRVLVPAKVKCLLTAGAARTYF
jgi:hypothetical protein